MRYTPENITSLKLNEIFVFGSNESGSHGGGAAKQAMKWGAKWGKPEGLFGKTYAIPTKTFHAGKTLSLSKIGEYVNSFISYATAHPEYTFLVTKIGCGLAGLTVEEVAPLFKDAIGIENIILPKEFH